VLRTVECGETVIRPCRDDLSLIITQALRKTFVFRFVPRLSVCAEFSRNCRSRILIKEIKTPGTRRIGKRSAAAWFGGDGVGT
jgi:hypothetical protein